MKSLLREFIGHKKLSDNSKKAYVYDLTQFLDIVGEVINQQTLASYGDFLQDLKPSVQKRKHSSVNQFLYYLYEMSYLDRFYKLEQLASSQKTLLPKSSRPSLLDWSPVYEDDSLSDGQLIALLILELGLLPSEILALKVADFDLAFRLVRVSHRQLLRILPLPEVLLAYLEPYLEGTYLFEHGGKPYTRQWLSGQVTAYLRSLGHADQTAQSLREQFILKEVVKGRALPDLAKHLGLKTGLTLEKYYQVDGY